MTRAPKIESFKYDAVEDVIKANISFGGLKGTPIEADNLTLWQATWLLRSFSDALLAMVKAKGLP